MNFSVGSSSVNKGESLRDTVETISAMGIDAIVVRHGSSGVPWQVAQWTDDSVVNAGDGWHEHPTQALLDCYTIRQARGTLEGLRIAIVGDIKHSRVARSDVLAFTAMGAEVTLVAPPTLLPPSLDGWPVAVSHELDGVSAEVSPGLDGRTVLDAGGCVVAPGLVDLHAHLREPGREEAETVESGSRAAALGGYTAVVAMPNTEPAIDSAGVVRQVLDLGAGACCDVRVAGAITKGRRGEELAPMGEMAALGVRMFTDDGSGVQDSRLMRRALEYASSLGVVLAQHCEDWELAQGGHMHEGDWSSRLGIPRIPTQAESMMVARDVSLAQLTGAPVHFLHLSTAMAIAMVRAAKAAKLAVTAEAAPHHFTLTDEVVASYDPLYKVNPPLRPPADVAAV